MAMEIDSEPTIADATRAGYVALLVFSIGTGPRLESTFEI